MLDSILRVTKAILFLGVEVRICSIAGKVVSSIEGIDVVKISIFLHVSSISGTDSISENVSIHVVLLQSAIEGILLSLAMGVGTDVKVLDMAISKGIRPILFLKALARGIRVV